MYYLAGVFDAEGCVSLTNSGNHIISIDMCNEQITNLFKDAFGGKIYSYKRENRKKVYMWRCPIDCMENFIEKMIPFSFFKKEQLSLLSNYRNQSRYGRRISRSDYVRKISSCKIPPPLINIQNLRFTPIIKPDSQFFEWFAGFMDGDGNFCCYEFENRFKSGRHHFSTTISCFNTMPNILHHIQERIEGSISVLKQNKNPVYKWICLPKNSIFLCESILPFIKIKKECCKLMIEFLTIFNSKHQRILGKGSGKGNWMPYNPNEVNRMREIIRLVKHQNSL